MIMGILVIFWNGDEKMRHKKFCCILLMEAVVCCLAAILQVQVPDIFFKTASIPFAQIGAGLRALSLSGTAGNAAAMALYVALGLLPCLAYGLLRMKKKAVRIDWLLAGLSLLLFQVLYYAVNPGLLQLPLQVRVQWLPQGVFYSALSGYLVLRVMCVYGPAGIRSLQQGLVYLLCFLEMVFVYMICGLCFGELLSSIYSLRTAQQQIFPVMWMSQNLSYGISYLFLILRFLIQAMPYVLDLFVVYLSVCVMEELARDRYSDQAVVAVAKLSRFCTRALEIIVLFGVCFNILQMIFVQRLYQTNVTVLVPVISVIFVLAVLLAARYIHEDQQLKQENDLFI